MTSCYLACDIFYFKMLLGNPLGFCDLIFSNLHIFLYNIARQSHAVLTPHVISGVIVWVYVSIP